MSRASSQSELPTWTAEFQDCSSRYAQLQHQEVGAAVAEQIDYDLGGLSSASPGGLSGLEVQHPYFRAPLRRRQFRRILLTLARWNPRVGYRPELGRFAALMLMLVDSEQSTFAVVTGLYDRLCLQEYFVREDRKMLKQDVDTILRDLEVLCPHVSHTFTECGCQALLAGLVEGWLLSLVAGACSTAHQPLSEIAPLVNRLMERSTTDSKDPRWYLRHAVVCLLACHAEKIEAARHQKEALIQVCAEMKACVSVGEVLFAMLDAEVSVRNAASSAACPFLQPLSLRCGSPAGFYAIGSTQAAVNLNAAAGALSASFPTASALHAVATVLGLAGAACSFHLGGQLGEQVAQEASQQFSQHCPSKMSDEGELPSSGVPAPPHPVAGTPVCAEQLAEERLSRGMRKVRGRWEQPLGKSGEVPVG
eukprot:CAMPEP_0175640036 /NCGR_PEP_ID=MMETSP0097-20121207/4043_1 /TAXON_ID=311494 /ORGANISM="Alexandrium monilatum, Strain CCMP3105" /LENGTH=420 /DNA_ID=CAMNT_0016945779 /DNA_START=36 /DNA_END=1295 /DNA_ORIENTATION=+